MKGAKYLVNNAGAGNGPDVAWGGGKSAPVADASFGGGSIKLQIKIDIGQVTPSYADVTGMSLSGAGMVVADLPEGVYRAVVTTATAAFAKIMSITQA